MKTLDWIAKPEDGIFVVDRWVRKAGLNWLQENNLMKEVILVNSIVARMIK
jgi:hypothetical protein